MSKARLIAIVLASMVAFVLLAGMLFGHTATLKPWTGVDLSVRDVSLALWAFLLPSWFTLEEAWFAPTDPVALAEFYALQKRGRITWLIVAGAVAILIGSTAPEAPKGTGGGPQATGATGTGGSGGGTTGTTGAGSTATGNTAATPVDPTRS